jgi:hypothetical protein
LYPDVFRPFVSDAADAEQMCLAFFCVLKLPRLRALSLLQAGLSLPQDMYMLRRIWSRDLQGCAPCLETLNIGGAETTHAVVLTVLSAAPALRTLLMAHTRIAGSGILIDRLPPSLFELDICGLNTTLAPVFARCTQLRRIAFTRHQSAILVHIANGAVVFQPQAPEPVPPGVEAVRPIHFFPLAPIPYSCCFVFTWRASCAVRGGARVAESPKHAVSVAAGRCGAANAQCFVL